MENVRKGTYAVSCKETRVPSQAAKKHDGLARLWTPAWLPLRVRVSGALACGQVQGASLQVRVPGALGGGKLQGTSVSGGLGARDAPARTHRLLQGYPLAGIHGRAFRVLTCPLRKNLKVDAKLAQITCSQFRS